MLYSESVPSTGNPAVTVLHPREPRTDKLIEASVQWAERIMRRSTSYSLMEGDMPVRRRPTS
jgi:hypothetical protein